MDDLINYLQKTTVRKASSISKIKTKSKPHPNQNDFTGIKMKNNINLIFNSFNEYNRRLKNSSNKLIKSQGNTIAKENIIIGLRKDLEYHKQVIKIITYIKNMQMKSVIIINKIMKKFSNIK